MDIHAAIDLHKTTLLRIVAELFAMLEGAQARVPLALHRSIARVLRPAESAVRRLIVTLATLMQWKAPPPRKRSPPTGLKRKPGKGKRGPFPLFDERHHFRRDRPPPRGPGPRIYFFGSGAPRMPPAGRKPVRDISDGMETSANLLARLTTLKDVLENLPREVKRLMRLQARRESVPELRDVTPLRPGRSPGQRAKPRLEIDHVLKECRWLLPERDPCLHK